MPAWREAKSLLKLLDQVNALWPNRSKESDGEIGDLAHSQRTSDHNPNGAGVVTAVDITNDPVHGIASRKLAERLVASKDSRIKYVISDGQICNSKVSPWMWRPYHGANGHYHHVHISVMNNPALYDDETAWNLDSGTPFNNPVEDKNLPSLTRSLQVGMSGADVSILQAFFGLKEDGRFGPDTLKTVIDFQNKHHLKPDGIVGADTWKALGGLVNE